MPTSRNLDIDLLRAFVIIADKGTVSAAAEELLRSQSTVSLQLKRLELALGKPLFERASRRMTLSAYGETMLPFARQMLHLNDEAVARVNEPELTGTVKLGVPEDFATTYMPSVLGEFAKAHPLVAMEVTCELTVPLLQRFRAGEFDLVLVKREPRSKERGVRVWRESLVWAAVEGFRSPTTGPLSLVVSPEPCVYRKRAIETLDRARRKWRIAYTCGSLAGAQAAVKAGLGISVLPRAMIPAGLQVLTEGLPDLRDTEIALLARTSVSKPAQRLKEHIIHSLE